jgi:hypothetical protein
LSLRSTKLINTLLHLLNKPAHQPIDTSSDFAPTPASIQIHSGDRNGGTAASERTPKRKRRLSGVAEAHGRSKRYCESSPPKCKLTLSRPLLSDPITFSSKPVPLQTPRANADLLAARSALVAAALPSPPKTIHTAPAKAATTVLIPDSVPAPSQVRKPYVVPEWTRTATATKPRHSRAKKRKMHASRPRHSSAGGHTVASLADRCPLGDRRHRHRRRLPLLRPASKQHECKHSTRHGSCRGHSPDILPAATWGALVTNHGGPLCLSLRRVRRCEARPLTPHGTLTQLPPRARCSRPTPAQMKTKRTHFDSENPRSFSRRSRALNGRGIGTSRPASPLRCCGGKGADAGEAAATGQEKKDDKDGNASSVDTPASSLHAPSDDDEEIGQGRGANDEEEEEEYEEDRMVSQCLWSDTLLPSSPLPPSSPLLSSSDVLSDALDSAGASTSSQPQTTPFTPTTLTTSDMAPGDDAEAVHNVGVDMDMDARNMAAFCTSPEPSSHPLPSPRLFRR